MHPKQPSTDDSYEYVGTELDVFSNAKNWKNYFASEICPYIRGRVLEVGAGMGSTAKVLVEQILESGQVDNWSCLEPDPSLAARLKVATEADPILKQMPIEIIVGTVEDLPAEANYDTLLYIDVLEHIEEDAKELLRAKRLLRPGGYIIVLSPAHQWLFSEFDKSIGHCRRYSRKTLRAVGPRTCELVEEKYLDCVGLFASLSNRLLLKQSMPDHRQIKFWDSILIPISRNIDSLFGHHIGKTLIAIWKNPQGTPAIVEPSRVSSPAVLAQFALLCSTCVVWFFLLAFMLFAQPVYDDFSRAAKVADIGVIESVKLEYHSWSGRWLGAGLSYVLGNTQDITEWYSLKLFGVFLLCYLSLLCFIRTILPQTVSLFELVIYASVGMALYWTGMPAPGETFYWLTGAFENHLSVACILLTLSAILALLPINTKYVSPTGYLAVGGICVMSFIIPGFHELFGCVWVCTLLFGLIATCVSGSVTIVRLCWGMFLVCGIGGLYLVVSAPGNAIRIEHQETQPDVMFALKLACKQFFICLREWLSDPRFICASFAFSLMPFRHFYKKTWPHREQVLWRFGFPLLGLLLMMGCLFGGGFARGKFLSDRPLNSVYGIFLLFWFGTILIWRTSSKSPIRSNHTAYAFAVSLLSFTLLFSGRMATGVISDLCDNAFPFQNASKERYRFAREAASQSKHHLSLQPFQRKPGIFKSVDLTSDPQQGPNQAFARYFGLESVVIEGQN